MIPIDSMNGDRPLLDSLVRDLARLAVDPPTTLAGRVFTSWCRVSGPSGPLFVAFTGQGISYVRPAEAVDDDPVRFGRLFQDAVGGPLRPAGRPPAGLLSALRSQRGVGLTFDLRRLTPFERDVLRATQQIPAGQTRPYGWVAGVAGRPRAVRAVGSALGRNPVPVLIPCHRVTRADGTLGDYVFGTAAKERLLRAERVDLAGLRELARSRIFFLGSDTTHIVCFPTCHHARRITGPHRVGFRTVPEAMGAGYRPCLRCRPDALVRTG
jgi:methylated-DNA-[protein]-cysteine S-methyltransferase